MEQLDFSVSICLAAAAPSAFPALTPRACRVNQQNAWAAFSAKFVLVNINGFLYIHTLTPNAMELEPSSGKLLATLLHLVF